MQTKKEIIGKVLAFKHVLIKATNHPSWIRHMILTNYGNFHFFLGKLHNAKGPAIEWNDGTKQYYYLGKPVPEDLYKDLCDLIKSYARQFLLFLTLLVATWLFSSYIWHAIVTPVAVAGYILVMIYSLYTLYRITKLLFELPINTSTGNEPVESDWILYPHGMGKHDISMSIDIDDDNTDFTVKKKLNTVELF